MRLFRINIGLPSTNSGSAHILLLYTISIESVCARSWASYHSACLGSRLTEARPFIFKCHGLKANLHSNHVLRSSSPQVALIDPLHFGASATNCRREFNELN
jgi:hypothetical protein